MTQQLTLLIPQAARSAHAELLAALGTENAPGQWMTFMDTVTRLLPDVLSSGRPTTEAIQRCAIGQLGFSSWTSMIEAPTDANGLGWNVSAWKAWRRAWAVVQVHPWLRDQPLTSSEVNTLAQDAKREGVAFPASPEELDAFRQGRKDAQETRRAESLQGLAERLEAAEKAAQEGTARATALAAQLEAANARARELEDAAKAANDNAAKAEALAAQLEQATARIEELAKEAGQLGKSLKDALKERDRWKSEAGKPAPALTRLQHLAKALGLG